MDQPFFWAPAASLETLRRRAELLKRLRAFFDDRGFLEVETPLLSAESVVDRHLDPLPVTLFASPREPQVGPTFWLQTSPEFCMKRLLAAAQAPGEPLAIYQVTRAFRGGETGALHNPEFTIAEWYRVGDDYAAGRRLLAELAAELLPFGAAEELTYREAFRRHAGLDPFTAPLAELRAACGEPAGAMVHEADRDRLLDQLLVLQVEPRLGRERPTILYDYPASQAALAQVRPGDPPLAERFELYVRGLELANGYHELLDPAVLRERNRVGNALRLAEGKYAVPGEGRLVAALEHGLPPCSGCALGFDRLVMAAVGATQISQVLAFPIDRA